jgi:hypothetical protein
VVGDAATVDVAVFVGVFTDVGFDVEGCVFDISEAASCAARASDGVVDAVLVEEVGAARATADVAGAIGEEAVNGSGAVAAAATVLVPVAVADAEPSAAFALSTGGGMAGIIAAVPVDVSVVLDAVADPGKFGNPVIPWSGPTGGRAGGVPEARAKEPTRRHSSASTKQAAVRSRMSEVRRRGTIASFVFRG